MNMKKGKGAMKDWKTKVKERCDGEEREGKEKTGGEISFPL